MINDASGFIYTALMNFVMSDSPNPVMNSGYTLTITAIGDDKSKGASIILNGVRIKHIGGLNFQQQRGDVQTFDVNCSAIDVTYSPGILRPVSGITGAAGNLLKGVI